MPPITTRLLAYRAFPVSILVFLTYTSIFLALTLTDTLEDVPDRSKWGGMDVKEAGEDLRVITSHPHPFNSHANDRVRTYLLSRLQSIASNYSHVHISDDVQAHTNGVVWANNGFGVYFEGTNLVVKVDGMGAMDDSVHPNASENENDNDNAILFSAHYDSVSTAPGATDDGMGVVTLLQLVKYFAEKRGRRSVVFNVNNGEEDWLNGAHVFMEHPWSNLTDTFLNLEGAAAGGRPILFRATSTTPLRALASRNLIPHPHANVLSSDAFSRGVIKSGTDYSVYVDGGMQGLDLAFYKGRSRYHTKYDSVQYTVGGERSLWSMMEVARGVGVGLVGGVGVEKVGLRVGDERLREGMREGRGVDRDEGMESVVGGKGVDVDVKGKKEDDTPVYFDLFKSILIIFPLSKLLIYNIVSLIVGPILLILLIVCERVILGMSASRSHSEDSSSSGSEGEEEEGNVVPGGYGATLRSSRRRNNGTGNGAGSGVGDGDGRRPVRAGTTGGYDVAAVVEDDVDDEVVGRRTNSGRRMRMKGKHGWKETFASVWIHVKFWVSLGVCVGSLGLWVWVVGVVNPFAIYASPYLILLSALSLTYLVQTYILSIPHSLPFSSSPTSSKHLRALTGTAHQQSKYTTFHHLYIFTWALVVLSTLGITNVHPGIASGYLVSVWNTLVGVGCVVGALERWVGGARGGEDDDVSEDDNEDEDEDEDNREEEEGEVYDELPGAGGRRTHVHGVVGGEEVRDDERAPLLRADSSTLNLPAASRHAVHRASYSPLYSSKSHSRTCMREREREGVDSIFWIAQFVMSVPVIVILLGGVVMLVLDGMAQGIVDGGSVWGVYILTALLSLLLVLPLSPFATKLSYRPLTYLVIGLFALSTLITLLSFPFTVEDPLKVFFQQKIQLSAGVVKIMNGNYHHNSNNNNTIPIPNTHIPSPAPPIEAIITSSLSGPKRYLRERIVGVMPSAQYDIRKGKMVRCVEDEVKKGLERCEWRVEEHMGLDLGDVMTRLNVGANFDNVSQVMVDSGVDAPKKLWAPKEYFEAEVMRTGPLNATFRVRGRNTRNCRIYFDEAVFWFGVRDGSSMGGDVKKGMQRGYDIPPHGIKEIRLWGREWEKEWVVDVDWGYQVALGSDRSSVEKNRLNGMKGRIACEWVEYESGMVDTGPGVAHMTTTTKSHPKIPAFEEVVSFLPEWAAVSKYSDGLVEVWAPFEI